MNCKPGDLALIIREPYAGAMVEVLYAAPPEQHVLPNGFYNMGSSVGSWVVKSLGSPFMVTQRCLGETRHTTSQYGVCKDIYLRPLPGKLEDEEIEDVREIAI